YIGWQNEERAYVDTRSTFCEMGVCGRGPVRGRWLRSRRQETLRQISHFTGPLLRRCPWVPLPGPACRVLQRRLLQIFHQKQFSGERDADVTAGVAPTGFLTALTVARIEFVFDGYFLRARGVLMPEWTCVLSLRAYNVAMKNDVV